MRKSTPGFLAACFVLPALAGAQSTMPLSPPSFSSNAVSALPPQVVSDLSNAPNPFDSRKPGIEGQTQISYSLSADFPVTVTLYDLFGIKVTSWQFAAGEPGGRAGVNHFLWDGRNEQGQSVAKGGYIAELEIDNGQANVTAFRKIGVLH